MRTIKQIVTTPDLNLTAALLAMGVPFDDELPYIESKSTKGNFHSFILRDQTTCGQYLTKDLIQHWNDPSFVQNNPEHPFAYIKAAFENRTGLLDLVKKSVPFIVIEKNGKYGVISENADKELQDKIIKGL